MDCSYCGQSFVQRHARYVTCSPECSHKRREKIKNAKRAVREREQRKLNPKPPKQRAIKEPKRKSWVCGYCRWCGMGYITDRAGTYHCSRDCVNSANSKARSVAQAERECLECGTMIIHQYTKGRARILCSDRCYKRRSGRAKTKNHRQRAKKYGVQYQPGITTLKVCDRDGWVCALCSLPINPSLQWPDDWSKTLDHIIPMSKGGDHVWSNVQAAHNFCNVAKGDGLGESRIFLSTLVDPHCSQR